MRRRLFNALCLLSLVLAVAVAALWVRSVWWADMVVVDLQQTRSSIHIYSSEGGISVGHLGFLWGYPNYSHYSSGPAMNPHRWLPTFQGSVRTLEFIFYLPAWLGVTCLPILPVWRLRRPMRGKMVACPRCGYDLRGSAGPACPECGRRHLGAARRE